MSIVNPACPSMFVYNVVFSLLSRLSDTMLEDSDQNSLLYKHDIKFDYAYKYCVTHRLKESTAMPRGGPLVLVIYSTAPDDSFSFPIRLSLDIPINIFITT